MLPRLIVLSGPPGVGKSTLAAALGERLPISVIGIDTVKASLARYGGDAGLGGGVGQAAFAAGFDLAGRYLELGVDVLVEKAWKRGVSEVDLQPLVARSRAVQVHLSAPLEVLVARGLARPSRPGLVDMSGVLQAVEAGSLAWSDFDPLDLDVPLLSLDATGPIDLEALLVAVHSLQ